MANRAFLLMRTTIAVLILPFVLSLFLSGSAKANATAEQRLLIHSAVGTGSVTDEAVIAPEVLTRLETMGRADIFVVLRQKPDLGRARDLVSKTAKGQFVFQSLRETADQSQAALRSYLSNHGIVYTSFFIANKIYIADADTALVRVLASRPEVERIDSNFEVVLESVPPRSERLFRAAVYQVPEAADTIEETLTFINVDHVWDMGIRGRGIVLAAIDSGIDHLHPALARHYRGCLNPPLCSDYDHNYNWYDPTNTYLTHPGDGSSHGTHVSGTMVGDDGAGNSVGVAPEAQTIHCKAFGDTGRGSMEAIVACLQWVLAPTDLNGQNPRPELAPDVLSNSWGYYGGKTTEYMPEFQALQAAGILVEAISHNYGPSCESVASPGSFNFLLTTGSVYVTSSKVLPGNISSSSGRGPSPLYPSPPDYVPDVMAPGENVRSTVPNNAYDWYSGTSMAGPHVVGLVGLLWAANPTLRGNISDSQQAIISTAVPLSGQAGSSCGGDYALGPNNDWGYGTIDALAATEYARSLSEYGTLKGNITDESTGNAIGNVTIELVLSTGQRAVVDADANGNYSASLPADTYAVSASPFGFLRSEWSPVPVVANETTTLNLQLVPAPTYLLQGAVRDTVSTRPLAARVFIDEYPNNPVWTDANGAFNVVLPGARSWTVRATPLTQGYKSYVGSTGTLNSDLQLNLDIAPDFGACSAPGYVLSAIYTENFDLSNGDFTVTKSANYATPTWAWGQPTSGPGQAHSPTSLWATKLDGDYSSNEDSYLVSPVIDLSAYAGQTIILNWWQWLQTEYAYDVAMVQASTDGGSQWRTAHEGMSGDFDLAWTRRGVVLDSSYAVANFRFRFKLHSDPAVTAHGWYIDDVTIGTSCDATPLAVELSSFTALEEFDGVTLGWETVSERGTAGFRLYRGTAPTGPWLCLTSSLIPSATPGGTQGSRYTWRDTSGRTSEVAWYLLEEVSLEGTSIRYGPVLATSYLPNVLTLTELRVGRLSNVFGLGLAVLGVLGAALCLSRRLDRSGGR